MTATPARPPSWQGWALLLVAACAALLSGAAWAQSSGPHESAMDWFMGVGSALALVVAVLGGWYGLREKRRREAEHEAAPLRALQAQTDRHAAALGLRDDDVPLRKRVKALEDDKAALRQEMATLRAVNEAIAAQFHTVVARVGAVCCLSPSPRSCSRPCCCWRWLSIQCCSQRKNRAESNLTDKESHVGHQRSLKVERRFWKHQSNGGTRSSFPAGSIG